MESSGGVKGVEGRTPVVLRVRQELLKVQNAPAREKVSNTMVIKNPM